MAVTTEVRSVGDISRVHARERPQRRAFVFEERITTFGELDAHASRVAQALIRGGLGPGDRIAYLGKNSDRFFELFLGAAKAGVVLTPVNWRLSPREVRYIIDDSDARLLFIGGEFADGLDGYVSQTKIAGVLRLDDENGRDSYLSWRDSEPALDPLRSWPADTAVLQLYTSGTTGNPKGAVLAHGNFVAMQAAQREYAWNRWTEADAALAALPFFHIAGTSWALTALYNGALSVIAREFDPPQVLGLLEKWRISKLLAVPAALQRLLRHPGLQSIDRSHLQYVLYGASPMPLELLRECMKAFECGFVQLYGMTETSGGIVALGPEDHDDRSGRIAAAGKPIRGVEIAILGEAGEHLAPYQIGEVVTRSAMNMRGYWKLPTATAAALSADNWLRTGDAGYLDRDGYLFICDRIKDLIISGGENIYPAEVENAIFGHPDVAEVAVIGVPSERWGEEVKAMVVVKPGCKADAGEILDWARVRIAAFKAPKSVEFIEALPRNASGKILRRELRAPYWKDRARSI